jgi:large conductance mechanosensitive channel
MSIVSEFKEFAVKGNVMDLAVGVVIGAAFNKIVSSLVDDLIMPLVGLMLGGRDFKGLFYALDGNSYPTIEAAQAAGSATLNYGNFIQNLVDFGIIALTLFVVVKGLNRLRRDRTLVAVEAVKPA